MIDMKQIGLNICRLRKAAGMTQTELADEILNDNRMGEITEKLLRNQPIENVTLKDVEEVAPILHEKEVDTLFGYLVM